MAKRRNLKKEKAQRNQEYARKFRKRTSSRYGRGRYNRRPDQSKPPENEEKKGTDVAAGETGGAQ